MGQVIVTLFLGLTNYTLHTLSTSNYIYHQNLIQKRTSLPALNSSILTVTKMQPHNFNDILQAKAKQGKYLQEKCYSEHYPQSSIL